MRAVQKYALVLLYYVHIVYMAHNNAEPCLYLAELFEIYYVI